MCGLCLSGRQHGHGPSVATAVILSSSLLDFNYAFRHGLVVSLA